MLAYSLDSVYQAELSLHLSNGTRGLAEHTAARLLLLREVVSEFDAAIQFGYGKMNLVGWLVGWLLLLLLLLLLLFLFVRSFPFFSLSR
jgi:hypothetical protein